MKKLFLILWILILGSPTIFADGVLDYSTGRFSDATRSVPVPIRDVKILPDSSIRVTYLFNSALLVSDGMIPESFWWKIGGFGMSEDTREVAVPMRKDSFVIPKGKIPVLSIDSAEYKNFNYTLCKGKKPEIESGEFSDTNNSPERIVGSYSYYPSAFVGNWSRNSYRDNNIFNVVVSALRYIAEPQNIQALTKLVYTVSFIKGSSDSGEYLEIVPPQTNIDDKICRMPNWLLGNGGSGNSGSSSSSDPDITPVNPAYISYSCDKTYLIITTDAQKQYVNDFIQWKRMQGYNVVLQSRAAWTYNSVKRVVDDAFSTYNDLYHLLIIGDHKSIPGKYSESQVKVDSTYYYTDYYFSFYGESQNKISDISVGRIPTSEPQEISNILSKIIAYEKNPSTAGNAVCTAEFEDRNGDGYEDKRFVLTSEEIVNYINQNTDFSAYRQFGSRSYASPLYWNKGDFSNGDSIPTYLQRPDFNWDASTVSLLNAMNRGCAILTYRGHGLADRWSWPLLKSSDLMSLSNRILPLVLSVCCHSGRYQIKNSFCRNLLALKNSGCSAVIGAAAASQSGYNDAFLEGMIDAIWPSPGLVPQFGSMSSGNIIPVHQGLKEIGEIMTQGLIRMGETYGVNDESLKTYTSEIYHLFGDPSMIFHTSELRDAYSIATVKRYDESVSIIPTIEIKCEEPCYIGIYNKVTGISKRHYGRYLNFWDRNADSCIVTIYDQNLSPYINQKYDWGSITLPDPIKLQSVRSNNNYCNIHIDNIEDEENTLVQLVVRNNYGTIVRRQDCDGQSDYTIDISDLNSGIYVVSLIKDENIVDSKHFVK